MFIKLAIDEQIMDNLLNRYGDMFFDLEQFAKDYPFAEETDLYKHYQNSNKFVFDKYSFGTKLRKLKNNVPLTGQEELLINYFTKNNVSSYKKAINNFIKKYNPEQVRNDPYLIKKYKKLLAGYKLDKQVRNKVIISNPYEFLNKDDVFNYIGANHLKGIPYLLAKEELPEFAKLDEVLQDIATNGATEIEKKWAQRVIKYHELMELFNRNKKRFDMPIFSHASPKVLFNEFNVLQTLPEEAKRLKESMINARYLRNEYNLLNDNIIKYFKDNNMKLSKAARKKLLQDYNTKVMQLLNIPLTKYNDIHNLYAWLAKRKNNITLKHGKIYEFLDYLKKNKDSQEVIQKILNVIFNK